MEKSFDFHLGLSDPQINSRLAALDGTSSGLDRRFTTSEESFLVLDRPFTVESFEVHHPVDQTRPSAGYRAVVRDLVDQWSLSAPSVFRGLRWYFDPRDLVHPTFLQVGKAGGLYFLVLVRPDLTWRPRHGELLEKGDNNRTPKYRSGHLFFEAEVLPLAGWATGEGTLGLRLAPLFPETFEGETGRGYFVTGRWIDHEVSRLLNRAALVPGTRTFPFFPLRCRWGTLSVQDPDPGVEGRRRAALALAAAWPLVSPWADRIQADLKAEAYREDHPLVEALRGTWAGRLEALGRGYRLEPYLNEHEHKEYRCHGV